jgi:hypothetical protein
MINLIYKDGRGHKMARPVTSREEYVALRNTPENAKCFYDARGGQQAAKLKQVQFNYNDLLPDGVLKGCCHPASTFAHDIDCQSAEEQAAIKQRILEKKDEIGLLELSGSANFGLHAVCRREKGKTILESQVKVSMVTQTEMDTNTHDQARVMFTGPANDDNLFYLDDAIFEEDMSIEESAAEFEVLKEREKKGQEEVPAGAKKAIKHFKPWENAVQQSAPNQQKTDKPETNEGSICEADERTRFIFRECMKEEGVTDADLVDRGGRHNSVKMILSSCTQLLTKEETLGMLKELMPDNWQDENIQTLVNDFYSDYYNPSQRLTLFQKRVFRESRRLGGEVSAQSESELAVQNQSELSKLFASKLPPEIPKVLPKLVKAVTQHTPQRYKATVAQAMFPPLSTYSRKLSFMYIDNQERDLRSCCLIIAGTGTGKDSCTKQPLQHIIADMVERDKENRIRLKKFNDEYNNKANNKQKPQRPDDLIIQTLKYDITKAALVQRMDDAQGAPLYIRLNELEQWDKIEGCTGRNNQFTTMKLCDDEGNDFGSDRASTQSVMASGCLHLNWNANTTLSKAMRYFKYVMTDGPISRLCLATIPDEEIGAEIAVFGNYDEKYDEALKPFIENLKAATGVIDCAPARKLARQLKDECADFARLSQDRVFDNLSHRALVHAFRKACLLYVANGNKWEKAIEDFCRWSLFYDLYLKMIFFGEQIRHADDDIPTSKRGPQNLLDFLPETFSVEEAKRVRQKQGMDTEKTVKMISTWKSRGYVIQISDFSFKKAYKDVTKRNKKQ